MSRLLPFPLLSAALFVMWLLLTQSISPGQILLGAAAAILGGQVMKALRPDGARARRPRAILALAGRVLVDIVRSNFAVAAIVLTRRPDRVSGFIHVPVTLTDRHALAAFALIITATPGTLWVEFDRRRGMLLVHVLDLIDEGEWIHLLKNRYEALLIEIFER